MRELEHVIENFDEDLGLELKENERPDKDGAAQIRDPDPVGRLNGSPIRADQREINDPGNTKYKIWNLNQADKFGG